MHPVSPGSGRPRLSSGAIFVSWLALLSLVWLVYLSLPILRFSYLVSSDVAEEHAVAVSARFWPGDEVARRRPNTTECEQVVLQSAFNRVPLASTVAGASPCSITDWADGDWVYVDDLADQRHRNGLLMTYANAFQPDYGNRTREPWRWEWRPRARRCRDLPPFDPIRLCAALGNDSVLVVGDSLQANFISAFRHQLDSERGAPGRQRPRPCQNRAWSDEYEASVVICPSGARLDYIRNDHLSLTARDDLECGDQCHPWVHALGRYAALFLNTGLHVVDIDRYQFQTRQTVDYLRRHYRGRVVYRLASAGHERCMEHARPWTRAQYVADADLFREKPFRWHYVDAYNDIAARQYGSLPGAVILDTDALVRLRPDAHRSVGDCLHQVTPGPWDYAALMLYYVLVGDLST